MNKIMFNSKYGLEQAVLEGRKTVTRRIAFDGEIKLPNTGFLTEGKERGRMVLSDGGRIVAKSNYAVGEVVAIAQAYQNVRPFYFDEWQTDQDWFKKGWNNKMFVKADLMRHHIQITNIKVERLQDISDEDCLNEGIDASNSFEIGYGVDWVYQFQNDNRSYFTPREAFAALIDKTSGKGVWQKNPYVFVYNFVLID